MPGLPGKRKAPAAVLDQRVCQVEHAQMILHKKEIRPDLGHVRVSRRIDKKEGDARGVQHFYVFRVKHFQAEDPCRLF